MHTLAQQFAVDTKTHLVLKGNHTMVAHPDNTSYINSTGNPGLATAGTGDVLAGVIGGLLAQGIDPSTAAEAGVYIHGLAGDLAAVEFTQAGLIASDVIDFLPKALTTYV
jgi:NAD(P)H-hydrate repair Nnr-like enzyme with NAD(P)H-hydrate dehydratase domain